MRNMTKMATDSEFEPTFSIIQKYPSQSFWAIESMENKIMFLSYVTQFWTTMNIMARQKTAIEIVAITRMKKRNP